MLGFLFLGDLAISTGFKRAPTKALRFTGL
jgi:hypothetical protein